MQCLKIFAIIIITLVAFPMSLDLISANPIPSVPAYMSQEFINITIEKVSGQEALVVVDGVYPMYLAQVNAYLYFPIPNEVLRNGTVKVTINGEPSDHKIVWEGHLNDQKFQYESILGVLPMVAWKVPFQGEALVRVTYSYVLRAEENFLWSTFKTIYAMGTGRYYMTYSKECTASINIYVVGFEGYQLNVFTSRPSSMGGSKSVLSLKVKDHMEKYYIEKSASFGGLTDDLIIELKKALTVDANPGDIVLESFEYKKGYFRGVLKIVLPYLSYEAELLGADYGDNTINVYISVKKPKNAIEAPTIKELSMSFVVPCERDDINGTRLNVFVNGNIYKTIILSLEGPDTQPELPSEESSLAEFAIVIVITTIAVVIIALTLGPRKKT